MKDRWPAARLTRPQDLHGGRPIQVSFKRVRRQAAQAQQTGRGNSRRRSIEKCPVFRGRIEIPWRNSIGGRVRYVVIGAALGGAEEVRIAAVLEARGEAVERPRKAARPTRIAAITLMRGLAQELARIGVEDALVGGRTDTGEFLRQTTH